MEKQISGVKIFCDGLDHPEGVAIHPDGTVWAGGEGGQIYCISADGSQLGVVANTGGFILGLAFSPDGSWLAICDNKHKCIWRLCLQSRELEVYASAKTGATFGIPNYPAFDDSGNLYVSDSGVFREVNGRIWKIDPQRKVSVWHNGPFSFSNGLAISPDRKGLYVVCTWLPGVERIAINADGTAGERETVVTLPETCPDGIAFDIAGNLYITCYAPNTIYRLSPGGTLSTFIHDWEAHTLSNPTNIAFGGKDNRTLFIANLGRWHISCLQAEVPGASLINRS